MRRDFDREVEEALARYAAVEPREGLEQRLLANLRAKPACSVARSPWWGRAGAVGLAVIALVTVFNLRLGRIAGLRVSSTSHGVGCERALGGAPGAVTAPGEKSKPKVANRSLDAKDEDVSETAVKAVATRPEPDVPRNKSGVRAEPTLEKFPAPEPLTEQEKLLVQFVEDDPRDSMLVAQSIDADLQKETDDMKAARSNTDSQLEQ